MSKKKVVIATHNSKFHADDVFSVAVLKKIFGDLEVVRTRDPKIVNKADFRVDIGDKYNHETKDYDHHQKDSPVRENGVPYAAFGLVWKHYGMELVSSEEAFLYVDERLVQYCDAGDNGVEMERSKIHNFSVDEAISSYNVLWNEDFGQDDQFLKAVEFAILVLDRVIAKANSVADGKDEVIDCLNEMEDEIVILSKSRLPKEILSASEAKIFIEPTTVGTWVAVGVPVEPGSYIRKKYFLDSWAGLLNEELEKVSGIKGLTFCHKHKFIVVGDTKESVLEAAKAALADE